MVGLIAFALGALAVTGLITIGFMKALRRWNAEIPGLLIANVLSLMTATIIGGFTLADGPDPVFAEAFAQYFLPQLVVLLWTFGAMGWLGIPVTLVTTILPVVLMAMVILDDVGSSTIRPRCVTVDVQRLESLVDLGMTWVIYSVQIGMSLFSRD